MNFSPQYPIAAALLYLGATGLAHSGMDPACAPLIEASEARIAAPAWQTRTEVPSSGFTMESIKVEGKFFTRRTGGPWLVSPFDLSTAEKRMLAQIADGTVKVAQCKAGGEETLDGIAVTLFHFTVEMPGAPAAASTLYIGKADGLPYAQNSDSAKTRYSYTGVKAPL